MRAFGRVLVSAVGVLAFAVLFVLALGPHLFGFRTLTVLSASMEPTIPPGSVVLVTRAPADTLAVGDVLTFRAPEGQHQVVTHRVVEIVEGGAHPVIRTKGDAMDEPDPWVAEVDNDVWLTRAHVPYVGYGIHWLRQPPVRRVVVYLLPAVLAVWSLVAIWRPRPVVAPVPVRAEAGPARSSSPWGRCVVRYGVPVVVLAALERSSRRVRVS